MFQSIAEVASWLGRQTDETAAAFSLRAALRSLPALESASAYWQDNASDGGVLQIAFEACAAASSGASSQGLDDRFGHLRAYAPRLKLYFDRAELLQELQSHDLMASARAANACGLALSAATASGADAAAFAVDAVQAALLASKALTDDSPSLSMEGRAAFHACAADAVYLEEASCAELSAKALWITTQPTWTISSWARLSDFIRAHRPDLKGWIGWYEGLLHPPFLQEEGAASSVGENGPFEPDLSLRPATIQPVWRGDRLTPADPADLFDGGLGALRDFLTAISAEISSLVGSFGADSNIDRGLLVMLGEMASWLSAGELTRALIFRLGRVRAILGRNAGMVDLEWPSFHATRFHELLQQIDDVLARSGPWRDFLRGYKAPIGAGDEKAAAAVVGAFATALDEHAVELVDPEIRTILRVMATEMHEEIGRGWISQTLFYDGLESLSNLLKKMIEPVLPSLNPSRRLSGEMVLRALDAFSESAETSVIKEAARLGEGVGPTITKVLKRFCLVAAGAAPFVFQDLVLYFPKLFAWLEPLLPMLREWLQL